MNSNLVLNKHLMSRAGFGWALEDIPTMENNSPTKVWKKMLTNSKQNFAELNNADLDYSSQYNPQESNEDRRMKMLKNRKLNKDLNLNWMHEMIFSNTQLLEKMSLFWHGHFSTRIQNYQFNYHIINIIRKNALGNFGDLLFEVSKSPAMLQFLNNQQNRKNSPNENFAREVLELFTMGRGSYTEKDIKEAARAFTGWGFDKHGLFVERRMIHDHESKSFLGNIGNFNGDDILKIILNQKQTAKFITKKIYQFFVNEKVNENHVAKLSQNFYNNNYDIEKLLTEIFTSEWFYSNENIGNRIKSPIELIVNIQRIIPMSFANEEGLLFTQKLLGQVLLAPPNVAGWPMGKSWIDSSTLMLRLRLPQIWSGILPMDYKGKDDDDINMGMKEIMQKIKIKKFQNQNVIVDWNFVQKIFEKNDVYDVLLVNSNQIKKSVIEKFSNSDWKMRIINIMSTPEFQMG